MRKRFSFILAVAMLVLVAAPVQASPNADTTVFSVERNESVTMVLEDFPSNATYYVFMGKYGTYAMNGELVSKLTTNDGGTFLAKFMIPDYLKGDDTIAIRFQSKSGESVWWNYFYNDTTNYNPYAYYDKSTTSDDTYNHLDQGFPTFVVLSVNKGASMDVETKYFPAGDRWAVYMKDGALDSETLYEVNGFDAAEGGIQQMTLPIPSELQYLEKIAVIFYRLSDGFRTYDLIWNRDCSYPNCSYEG